MDIEFVREQDQIVESRAGNEKPDILLPLALDLLAMRGPLLVGLEVEQGRLERAGEGDHHGAGVVLVHVLLDLRQPEEGGIMHLLKTAEMYLYSYVI